MESEGQAQQPGQEPVPEFDKDQPNELPSQPTQEPVKHEEPVPSFDEGDPKPAPIESTTVDYLRTASPDPRTVPRDGPDDIEEPRERNTK